MGPALVFLTVKLMTVAGRLESSVWSGTKGENASRSTATSPERYCTRPIGYSPRKRMSEKPVWSSARVLPPTVSWKVCFTDDSAGMGVA